MDGGGGDVMLVMMVEVCLPLFDLNHWPTVHTSTYKQWRSKTLTCNVSLPFFKFSNIQKLPACTHKKVVLCTYPCIILTFAGFGWDRVGVPYSTCEHGGVGR